MCPFDMVLYPTEKVSWHLYTLFLNDVGWFKVNCNYEVKLQTHNVAYNLNRDAWAINALATKNYKYNVYRRPIRSISGPNFN